jgi:hypothetical protein
MKYKLTKAFYPEYENLKDEYTLETTEEQEAAIKAAREFIQNTPGICSVDVWCNWPDEYGEDEDEDRIDVTYIMVYSTSLYWYCQSKYDSHAYWEYDMEAL